MKKSKERERERETVVNKRLIVSLQLLAGEDKMQGHCNVAALLLLLLAIMYGT